MTIKELYTEGLKRLREAGISEETDARILIDYLCHVSMNDILVHGERQINDALSRVFLEYIDMRCTHIPLQHLTGEQEFMGLNFRVSPDVLVPRQDTEILVEEVMRDMFDGSRILDMCTGSGCILISLLHYSNDCEGVGVDISEKALLVAKENADRIGVKADFVQSDLFENVSGKFDIIVSNPPYIRTADLGNLMDEVRLHEPAAALDGGEDGLFFYRKIISAAHEYLRKEGRLYFEIGCDESKKVMELMKESGFADVRMVRDYASLPRVITGRVENNV